MDMKITLQRQVAGNIGNVNGCAGVCDRLVSQGRSDGPKRNGAGNGKHLLHIKFYDRIGLGVGMQTARLNVQVSSRSESSASRRMRALRASAACSGSVSGTGIVSTTPRPPT